MENVKNNLKNGDVFDLSEFYFGDFDSPLQGLILLEQITAGKVKGMGIFRCKCNSIFLFPLEGIDKDDKRVQDGILLCSKCSGSKIEFKITPTEPSKESEVEKIVDSVIVGSKANNKFTFCFYLWGVLPKEKKIDTIFEAVSSFTNIVGRIETERRLKNLGFTLPDMFEPFSENTDIRLMLIIYCHLLELTDFLDILYSLLAISTKEYSCVVETEEGQPAFRGPITGITHEDLYDKLKEVIKFCKAHEFTELKKLLERLFKHYIRNAVYHSQYEITDKEIIFRYREGEGQELREKRKTIEEFTQLFKECLSLYAYTLGRLGEERQKMIEEGPVMEGDWKLTPITKGTGLSIQVTNG
jgi:hypothetical protein